VGVDQILGMESENLWESQKNYALIVTEAFRESSLYIAQIDFVPNVSKISEKAASESNL
jgi:hypothetical protein